MADDVTLNAGSGGDVIAADDIGGVKFQRVKITTGADGSNDGDVSSSNPLPVQDSDVFGFQTTATLANGATYDSGVLSLSPEYSQVQTTVLSDQDGSIVIYWYTDAGGTDLVRTLAVPYTASTGFQFFAAPAFTPYVKYTFLNNSGSDQTDFHFDTKFMRRAMHPQILRVDGTVVSGMVATLNRSVISGETTGGGGAFVNVKVNPSGTLQVSSDSNVTEFAGTAVSVGTGAADAGTQRVVVAGSAHDDAVSGSPLLQGAEARTANPTAVGNGDAVRLMADDVGRQVVAPHGVRDLTGHANITLSSGTETTLISAGAAGVFRDLLLVTLSNTSSTAVRVDIRDSTGGTIRYSMFLAADGGGAVIPFPAPFKQAAAANNWTAQLSSAVTDVRVMAQYVENV